MAKPIHVCVQEAVTEANLSHESIAKQTGWSEQRVYRLLTGRTDISADDMLVFASLVKRPVADLYPDDEAKAS